MLKKVQTSTIRLVPFEDIWSKTLISWIHSNEELYYWSGKTFEKGFSERFFRTHRTRSDIHCLALSGLQDNLIAYGEIVLDKVRHCTLCRVIVCPQKRRMGYGRIFCESAMQWAVKSLGCKKMTLNVLRENRAALACYLSLGFKVTLSRPRSRMLCGKWHDLLFMSVDLQ